MTNESDAWPGAASSLSLGYGAYIAPIGADPAQPAGWIRIADAAAMSYAETTYAETTETDEWPRRLSATTTAFFFGSPQIGEAAEADSPGADRDEPGAASGHLHLSMSRAGSTTAPAAAAVPVEDQIDRAIAGLCPCGAEPVEEFHPYCSDDCVPNIRARDTDTAGPGAALATPMRWLPDLLSAADDSNLLPREPRAPREQFWGEVFDRVPGDALHLRLDDGHRFVGVDVPAGDPDTLTERCERAWQRLTRELTDRRRAEPEPEPARGAFPGCECPSCRPGARSRYRRERQQAPTIQVCTCGRCDPDGEVARNAEQAMEQMLRAAGVTLMAFERQLLLQILNGMIFDSGTAGARRPLSDLLEQLSGLFASFGSPLRAYTLDQFLRDWDRHREDVREFGSRQFRIY
jgi:hypothetical protein